ncbi:DUF4832 domain-containing protein [Lactovum odontotermitis]
MTKKYFKGFSADDRELLNNTDRGFRLETYCDLSNGRGIYQYAETDAIDALNREYRLYQDDHPVLAQVYFYLTGYKAQDLDKKAFAVMEAYFDALKKLNLKAVLRFAYVWKDREVQAQEPELKWILRHLDQLKDFLAAHENQILTLQAGIIGAWGEWAFKARERIDETAVLQKELEIMPETMPLQVRYLNIRNRNVDCESKAFQKIGFHDDFLIGIPHVWNSAGKNEFSFEYRQLSQDSKNVINDGEMIWWWANPIYLDTKIIDPVLFARRLASGHFTSLSLAHNYREMEFGSFEKQTWINELRRNGRPDSEAEEISLENYTDYSSMIQWKRILITPQIIAENKLPVQKEWLLDENGQSRRRSFYEYFRDYLGYRIQAESIEIKDSAVVTISLKNYGFSAPHGLKAIEFVQLNEKFEKIESCKFADLSDFQTLEQVSREFSGRAAHYGIALIAKDGMANRLANDEINFVNGVNVLL